MLISRRTAAIWDWKTQVKEDLRPFAGPGQQITWLDRGNILTADWESRDRHLTAAFSFKSPDQIRVRFEGAILSYQEFLASSALGDMLALAKMVHQTYKSELYIATKASDRSTRSTDSTSEDAVHLLRRLTMPEEQGATRILFVTAEAGAGKSSVLRELVRQQAQRFLQADSTFLYLYVNAQGRALARFDEALAVELQDLQARLTYHAIPTLTRNNLIVPVVDGFDELLGVAGYDDAFASLQRFIDELAGHGQLIASARSSYYEQEFLQRATLVPQSWELVPIEVQQWGDEEFEAYIGARYEWEPSPRIAEAAFLERIRHVFSMTRNRDLVKKPLFVSRVAALLLSGEELSDEGSLIEQLITGYLERERTEKLLDSNGEPYLSASQLEELFALFAEEMWVQQTRELDTRSSREVAEVYLSAVEAPQSTRDVVTQRMPALAFLRPGRGPNRVTFEHEIYFAYFLAKGVAEAVAQLTDGLRVVLSKGVLPSGCADFATARLRSARVQLLQIVGKANEACEGYGLRLAQVRENAGALVAASIRVYGAVEGVSDIHLKNLVFGGESFVGITIRRAKLESVECRRVDLSAAILEQCIASGSVFIEPLIDPATTRLQIFGLNPTTDIVGLRVPGPSQIEVIYAPERIAEQLRAVGLPSVEQMAETRRKVSAEVVQVLERLMSAFERSNVIWPGDERFRRLTQDRGWEAVRSALLENGIVSREVRAIKGVARDALRRNYLPEQVLRGLAKGAPVEPAIQRFWQRLEEQSAS